MKHCLSLIDYPADQIQSILELGKRLKAELKSGQRRPLFDKKVLGLLFSKPSLRTRVSFESLVSQHGGASLYLGQDVGWPGREPACDFFPILTRYLDILVIRGKRHADVVEAASFSSCPVINGLTDASHPCQALADMMTMQEHSGGKRDFRVAYIGDANNVSWSLGVICAKLGIELMIAAPAGYQFSSEQVDELNRQGSRPVVTQSDDPGKMVRGADFIYTDVWTSMGQEDETAKRLAAFRDYQVNDALMSLAERDAKFLHCLPARRGEEVTSSVIDGPRSIVIDQAENRLHAQKGLVATLLGSIV